MGTRNITKVIYEGKAIIAQYGQWDGYPEGQGTTIFYTLQDPETVEGFLANVSKIYYPSDDELQAMWKPFTGNASQDGWVTLDEGKAFGEKYPTLTRDTGGEIFRVVANSEDSRIPMVLDLEFENDTLMCEAVYTIDLDNQTFNSKWDRWNDDKVWACDITLTFDHLRLMDVEQYHELFRQTVDA